VKIFSFKLKAKSAFSCIFDHPQVPKLTINQSQYKRAEAFETTNKIYFLKFKPPRCIK
jgi:hypothetical protein